MGDIMSTIGDREKFINENSDGILDKIEGELKRLEGSKPGSLNGQLVVFLTELRETVKKDFEDKDFLSTTLVENGVYMDLVTARYKRELLDKILPERPE